MTLRVQAAHDARFTVGHDFVRRPSHGVLTPSRARRPSIAGGSVGDARAGVLAGSPLVSPRIPPGVTAFGRDGSARRGGTGPRPRASRPGALARRRGRRPAGPAEIFVRAQSVEITQNAEI
jgi:hypothetical protein